MRTGLLVACALLALAGSPSLAQTTPAIDLSPIQIERLGISLQEAKQADSIGLIDLVGRVSRAPSGMQTAIAPFSGVIAKVHVAPGAAVRPGDAIITVASRDYAATASSVQQAQAEHETAKTALARQKQVVELGLAPRASLEEAEVRVKRAGAQLQEARALASSSSSVSGQSGVYVVRAPAAGRLSAMNARVGETVEAMEPIASIATSSDMWIELQVPARMIGAILPGDAVRLPDGSIAPILSVTDVIDPATRSASAVASAPATFRAVPGQLIRARLVRDASEEPLVQIPSHALVQLNGKDHVFQRTPDGFSPIPVDVAGRTAEVVTISDGLRPGDRIATSGLSELKALALQRAE